MGDAVRSEFRWIIPATALVAAQQLACLFLGLFLHMHGWPPFINYGLFALGACSIAVAVLMVRAWFVTCWRKRPTSPIASMLSYFAERRTAMTIFGGGFVLAWLQLVCLTWTKALIPVVSPLWADPFLARFDAMILGADAWRVTYPALHPIGRLIDTLYALWFLFLELTFAAVLLSPPSRRKSVTALSFFTITAIVGVAGEFVLPSGGPIFWSRLGLGHRFDQLVSEPHARMIADYLWRKYGGDTVDFASGISAFPSMHIALTSWMVFAIHALFPKLKPLAWAYFLVVVFGSMYLGWHYLADGLGAVVGAVGCWFLARALVDRPLQSWAIRLASAPSVVSPAPNFSSIHKQ